MARFSGEAIQEGLSYFVWLLGMVSLQLAIFNFLPIPLLDGGHLFILGIEAVRRRDLSVELKFRLLQTGFMILASLFVMVLVFDVLKLL
jgi:regulator of sigma E protease